MSSSTATPSRPGPIRRFFRAIWDTINFARRLVFNLLFLLVLVIVIAALAGKTPVLAERSALVIAPEGAIVEQYTSDAASRALAKALGDEVHETQMRDLLGAIRAATTDKRIERIVLLPDKITAVGFAQLHALATALAEFRAAGKQVVAYGDSFDQKQYYLAAQADEVYLHPSGALLMEGLGRYRQYYREGLQDKLGVDINVFRVGEFKSAVEPYVLDAASPEAKQADLYWMNDVWQRFLADIARVRKLDAAILQANIDDLPAQVRAADGDLAKMALQQRLVDALKTGDEVEALLIERGVADEDGGVERTFRQVALDDYLAHVAREHPTTSGGPLDTRPQVAVVVAQGDIAAGDLPAGMVGGESTARLLRIAREDDDIKAVVLRVDSPGGGAFPSEQIRREVELIKRAGKPVVVSMGNVAASGGYWISMNADRIYADASTITGSIGIYGLVPTIPRTLDKIGVHTDGVGTTRFAGAFDLTRPLDPAVGEVIQAVIEHGYREFIGKVADARDSTPDKIDEIARGRVWTGAQAKQRGLVDALGGLDAALADAARRAKLDKGSYGTRYVEKPLSPFEQFAANLGRSARAATLLHATGLDAWLAGDGAVLRTLDRDLRFLRSQQANAPVNAVAHCLCAL